ncbi:MAG TPA: SGNH/GDSL hydrolase family protein [Acidobacteriota bacterium]|nr:SGNH/GDSL hydrolase family protein [Acidobacteriota bacterium]
MSRIKNWFRQATDRFARYIALGDSMSIDDYPGEGKGAASLLYRNQDHLYPEYRQKDLCKFNREIDFLNLAQDGATSRDVLHEQLSELRDGSRDRTLLTLTAGGNDILSHQAESEEVLFRIRAILDRVRQIFPQSEIIVGTIYDPSDGAGDLFGKDILEKELQTAHAINDGIRALAQPPAIRVAEIHKHFLGHGVHCKDPSNPYFHPEDPSLWYVLTIEPNSRGAHEIRSLFWKTLHHG